MAKTKHMTDIYVCIAKCIYKNKMWDPSSHKVEDRILIVPAGEKVNSKHFAKRESDSIEVKEAKDFTSAPAPRPMSKGSQVVNRENRQTLIIQAIKNLNPEVDYWYGKPKVQAIETELNMNITKEERDLAFEKMKSGD